MRHLGEFILSEGEKFADLEPVQEDILPRKATGSFDDGLDGWSYMMRNPTKDFALLYFENGSEKPILAGFIPDTQYTLNWYDPVEGVWEKPLSVRTDNKGSLIIPAFPDSHNPSVTDRALKIKKQ